MTDTVDPTAPDSPSEIEAPPKPELSAAGRVAAGISMKGVGVDGDEGVSHPRLRLAAMVAVLVAVGFLNPWMLVVISAILLMITLHEFGHYYMAKRAGMKVTEFFLGFGPRIWSTRRGETEYGIKAIPAGAYVKLIGMTNLDEVDPADEPRTYRQKSFWQRFGVAVAGSTMHFVLAIALIYIALVAVGQPAGTTAISAQSKMWEVSDVSPGTGAAKAGLQEGDRIVEIGGHELKSFEDLRPATEKIIKTSDGEIRSSTKTDVVYERDGKRRRAQLTITPFLNWYVDKIEDGSAVDTTVRHTEKYGKLQLEAGDRVVAINGHRLLYTPVSAVDRMLRDLDGKAVTIRFERKHDGDVVTHHIRVKADHLYLGSTIAYVGIGARDVADERVNPLVGLYKAPKEFIQNTGYSLAALGRFFSPSGIADFGGQVGHARKDRAAATAVADYPTNRSAARSDPDGPPDPNENRLMSIFGLVRVGSEVGKTNPASLITLFALINIFIGVFNLLPLLPFDGGHVVIAIYEKIQEKRLNRRRYFVDAGRLLPILYAVVVLLGLLFVSTIYLDLANPLQA